MSESGTWIDEMPGRLGPYLAVVDEAGCRHLVRITAIQVMSDRDPCADSTSIIIAGRSLIVPRPLDQVVRVLKERGD